MKDPEELENLRRRIAEIDEKIISNISQRMALSASIGKIKAGNGLPIEDLDVEKEVIQRATRLATKAGLDEEFARSIFNLIIKQSKDTQRRQLSAENSDTRT